jgi:hypothetical protein
MIAFSQDYAVNAWEVYAAHVQQCKTFACSQCDLLIGYFNRDFVVEQREHERLVAVNDYKGRYESYDISDL